MHDAAAHISSDSEESPLTGNETHSSFKTQLVSDPPERVRTGLTGAMLSLETGNYSSPHRQAGISRLSIRLIAPLYILSENLCSAAAAVEATAVVAAAAAAAAAAPRA